MSYRLSDTVKKWLVIHLRVAQEIEMDSAVIGLRTGMTGNSLTFFWLKDDGLMAI